VELADREAGELEEIARRFESSAWSAMAQHARARVHSAREEWEGAYGRFADARRFFQNIQSRYEAARCLVGQAAAARFLGPDAPSLAEQAASELRSLGAAACDS
jgi:hypothetical protein